MNRRTLLRRLGIGSAALFIGIKLPEAKAVEPEVFVSRPLTDITVKYLRRNPRPIPFGPMPPHDPEIGDRWWVLGKRGHYELTEYNGHSWEGVR